MIEDVSSAGLTMGENNEKIKNTCRLCLTKTDDTQLVKIFSQTHVNGVPLVMKIMVCVSLTIQADDPFPKKICKDCEDSVNAFYSFRETCSRAYFTLIQNFGGSKDPVEEAGSKSVGNLGSDPDSLSETERLRTTEDPPTILSADEIVSPDEQNCAKKNDQTCNEDLDLERKIPQHHIMCVEKENNSIDLRKELNSEDNILPRNESGEGVEDDSRPLEMREQRDIPGAVEELSSTVEEDSLAPYDDDVDCYQVEEIREQILCGKEMKERIRYRCLRCENNFEDLDSVSAHYADFCHPVNYQETEDGWNGSNEAEGSSNYIDTFEYLDENFQMKTKENEEDVNSTNNYEISELERITNLEKTGEIDQGKKYLSPNLVSTSSCNPTMVSKKSQQLSLGKTRKRKSRWLGKIEYPCPECDRIFTSSSLLKRHSSVHTGERPHACEVCDRKFAQLGQLNFHRKFHNNPRYRCHICSKPFLRPSDIEKHMRTHTGEKPFDCKICLRSFAQLGALQQHTRIHSGEKPYSCEICGKRFSQKANKTKHVKIHREGERPHTCYICGRSFSELSEMELHRAGHGGGRPRKCDYCEDSFRKLSELNHHVRRFHTFERQHKCMFCPKEFYSIYNLKQHVMVHTGQRPYACSKCDLRFTQKGNLTKHFERKHSEFVEKKDSYILVQDKSLDDENLIFVGGNIVNEDDPDDNLIVEREETIESEADTILKRNRA